MVDEALPSMVIFDTKLPDMKSMELIERLQRHPSVFGIPCVVLSSHSDPEEMQACLQAGCGRRLMRTRDRFWVACLMVSHWTCG